MGAAKRPDGRPKHQAFDGEFDLQVAARLQAALVRTPHPMLIADDQRRWVSGNAAGCRLLGTTQETVSWHTMDDFTPVSDRSRLKLEWADFVANDSGRGRYQLYVPGRNALAVGFGAIANVLPGRHLAMFTPPGGASTDAPGSSTPAGEWRSLMAAREGRVPLTRREREIMALAAAGGQNGDMAARLFLSPETIKSHVQNAMGKLGARTRAHAVAIALVTGQITWSDGWLPSG
jgi:DNA-binding CsgD family transcriptional regulator